jgi:peroxiredoxin
LIDQQKSFPENLSEYDGQEDSIMSKTESAMVELGTVAPAFELPDVITGKAVGRDDVAKNGLLVMFICVHCPYVKHVEAELARIGADYEGKIGIAAISSNDVVAYPQDGPEEMKAQARRLGFRFPYLFDESQEVALSYHAACTPDFYLFDREMKLVYRGQLDDSRPRRGDAGNDIPVTGRDLRKALDEVVAGKRPDTNQRTSLGCNIKWREA